MPAVILDAGLVVALGALVQGAVGYGMALVAAPLLALVDPALVPVPLILLATVHSVLAVIRDGRHADWPGIGWAMLGRLPGTGLGVLAVVMLSQRVFSLVVGLCVLACVVLSLLAWRPRPRPRALLLAGVASGAGGTAAGIGGPPIALLYQRHTGPAMRSILAASFFFGTFLSVVTLALARQVGSAQVALALGLAPLVGAHQSNAALADLQKRTETDPALLDDDASATAIR
ncbi:MAG: TSUP family transporter, partial [Pseudonocardiaceae bacterium]